MKGSTKASSANYIQAIAIQLGSEQYGIRTASVREVLAAPRLTRVPHADPYIRGVINLRGNILPVIDLPVRLGLTTRAATTYGWVVVVDVDGESVGIGAEKTSKLLRLPSTAVVPPPPMLAGIAGENIEGVARLNEGFLIFLDLRRTLGHTAMSQGTVDAT